MWHRSKACALGLLAVTCAAHGTHAEPVPTRHADGAVWQSEEFGVRLELPEGWTVDERTAGGGTLYVTFVPPDAATPARVVLRSDPASPPDAERMREAGVAAVAATPGYDNPRPVARRIGGRAAPALEIDADQGQARFLLRQAYVVEHGLPFILQDYADLAIAERMAPVFDAIWDGLEFPPRSEQAEARARLEALAARCGSEVAWAGNWDEAAARARAEHKPVLVAARIYPGYALSDDRMSGAFMDPAIVALVNARYVPMLLGQGDAVPFADPKRYGLGPHTFGEAALVVSPEGEVLGESRVLTDSWLREALALAPRLPGDPVPPDATGLSRARALCDRGALDAAQALLAEADTPEGLLLRARLHRRLQRGDEALADLDRLRTLSGAGALGAAPDLERARVLVGLRRLEEADALLADVIERAGSVPDGAGADANASGDAHAAEALLWRATALRALGRRDEAEGLYRRVLDEHGETRWAWSAAAALTSTAWELGVGFDPGWLTPEAARELEPADHEPLTLARAARGSEDALAYLLGHQEPDGSWRVPAELGRDPAAPRHDFELAVTALCIQALLPHREQPDVAAALARAEDWLGAAVDEAGDDASFMDYAVWSRAYMLWCVADLVRAGGPDRAERAAAWDGRARRLVAELARREKPGGGWSYYVTRDVRAAGDASAQAMSFTTSAVVLALLAAEDAGLDVPRAMVERGMDTIERAGAGRRSYAYMVYPSGAGGQDALAIAGDAGRGPVCALALYRGGRVSLETIEDALDRFEEHRGTYASELGKTLLHTGPEGQGSHYLMFDYANAAFAAAELPHAKRIRARRTVLGEVLRAHTTEGAYLDTAVNGRAYGAAMALLALDALR